jgi:predicted  nucleic acid-binding Zn-ribbon protein
MDTASRKAVKTAKEKIEVVRSHVEDLQSELETLKDQEQEFFDDMPGRSQESEKGIKAEANVSKFEDAVQSLDLGSSFDDAVRALDGIE